MPNAREPAVREQERRGRHATHLNTVFHRIVLPLQRLVQKHVLHRHRLLLAEHGPQLTDDIVVLLLFLHQLLEVDVIVDLHLLRPNNTLFRQPIDLLRREERPLRPRPPTVGARLLLEADHRHCLWPLRPGMNPGRLHGLETFPVPSDVTS